MHLLLHITSDKKLCIGTEHLSVQAASIRLTDQDGYAVDLRPYTSSILPYGEFGMMNATALPGFTLLPSAPKDIHMARINEGVGL